jgi:uncharacterized protein
MIDQRYSFLQMKKWLLFLLVLVSYGFATGQSNTPLSEIIKSRPVPIRYVHDYTGVLSPSQLSHLENKLRIYDDSTSNQVAILLVKTLEGKSIEDVGLELGRTWGVGNTKINNGVVIIAAINDRKIRIEVGRGLEGTVTDYTSGEIIDNDIKPNFRLGKYYEGLEQATNNIVAAIGGEYKAPDGYHKNGKSKGSLLRLMVMLFVIFIILSVISKKGGGGGGGMLSRRGYRDWAPPVIIGNWGGGGSGGNSGGGGWSGGFGGGDFGGGGASGDW